MEATTASTFIWKRRTFALHTIHTGYRHWGNKVSLYYTQKLLYQLNRDQSLQEKFFADKESVLTDYELTEEEHAAIVTPDIGLLYILGVNGQILMHFAAMCGYAWPEYIQSMRDALNEHGNVKAGLYVTTDGKGAT